MTTTVADRGRSVGWQAEAGVDAGSEQPPWSSMEVSDHRYGSPSHDLLLTALSGRVGSAG
jgi:hypothetical protein